PGGTTNVPFCMPSESRMLTFPGPLAESLSFQSEIGVTVAGSPSVLLPSPPLIVSTPPPLTKLLVLVGVPLAVSTSLAEPPTITLLPDPAEIVVGPLPA